MSHPDIDFDAIRALASILDETGLSEIEVGEGDRRLRVARAPAAAAIAAPVIRSVVADDAAAVPSIEDAVIDAGYPGAVASPMVGTAYRSPEPGAPQFVKEGDTVNEGQTLFIIEAMKTMNPIRAPRGGRIARIMKENGAPVEFGEVLLIIE